MHHKSSFAVAVLRILAGITAADDVASAVLVVVVMVVRGQLVVARTSGSRRFCATSAGFFLLFFTLLAALLNVLGDTLAINALASLAHVSAKRSLLLLLAEGARVLC